MFDEHNQLTKSFRMVRDAYENDKIREMKLRLICKRQKDGRVYNLPTIEEIAGLVVGDVDSRDHRDIIIHGSDGQMQRIHELHPLYLPLQYPILFPYGEDGYREDIMHNGIGVQMSRKNHKLTIREYMAYLLQYRYNDNSLLYKSKRLLQQFIVDGYTMIESSRLSYIRSHQRELRAEMYKGLSEAVFRGEMDASCTGKRVILPSSFTGGARYMIQNYRDAMAICKWGGYPDLFITFTCNPKWPELQRHLAQCSERVEDQSHVVARFFHMKLMQLIKTLRHGKFFGSIKASM